MSDDVMQDEKIYLDWKPRIMTIADILEMTEQEHRVMPHNTMRFDVQLSYVYGLIDDGDVTKEQIAKEISDAIVQAVEKVCGRGFCGEGRRVFKSSMMMHREEINFDFS